MSPLFKIFSKDRFHDQAARLVSSANIVATSSFVPLLEQYPFLSDVKAEAWDFFATEASIFVALNNLKIEVSSERFMILYSVLLPTMLQWNERSEDVALDCQKFVARTVSSEVSPYDALGMWVLWNVMQKEPSPQELQAAPAIGNALSAPFQDWWKL